MEASWIWIALILVCVMLHPLMHRGHKRRPVPREYDNDYEPAGHVP